MPSPERDRSPTEFVVPAHLERSHEGLRAASDVVNSASYLLDELAVALSVPDLGSLRCLDVGCGVKFTRELLTSGRPIGHYFGIDVFLPVIEFLTEAVTDDRFTYRRLDVYNERYNPTGRPLSEVERFPVEAATFDVCLGYSLFTHLDPADTEKTLSLMRAAVVPGGRAVFTAFLDEHSETEEGWVDTYSKALGGSVQGIAEGSYKDVFEDNPLKVAMFDRSYLTRLMANAGWRLDTVRPPSPYAQHTIVATAV